MGRSTCHDRIDGKLGALPDKSVNVLGHPDRPLRSICAVGLGVLRVRLFSLTFQHQRTNAAGLGKVSGVGKSQLLSAVRTDIVLWLVSKCSLAHMDTSAVTPHTVKTDSSSPLSFGR